MKIYKMATCNICFPSDYKFKKGQSDSKATMIQK